MRKKEGDEGEREEISRRKQRDRKKNCSFFVSEHQNMNIQTMTDEQIERLKEKKIHTNLKLFYMPSLLRYHMNILKIYIYCLYMLALAS